MSRLSHAISRGLSRLHGLCGAVAPEGLRILLYHSVGTPLTADPYGTSIAADLFKSQMLWLSRRDREQEPTALTGPGDGRSRVAITFDDGYQDNLRRAAPLLAELGLPCTVFLTAGYIRRGEPPYLSPAEAKALAGLPGVDIGSHGDSHAPLDALDDRGLRRELAESRAYLEDLIGRPITALSYPHGRVNRRVRDAAQEAGYRLGCCSRYGRNAADRDPLLLCRTEITRWDDTADFTLKLLGHWDWYRLRHPDPAQL